MEIIDSSKVTQSNFTNSLKTKKTLQKTPIQKENGDKLLELGAKYSASVAFAGVAINQKKKTPVETPDKTLTCDLKFDNGVAMKDGVPFTGIAEQVNEKGDKFQLVYKDGKLKASLKNNDVESGATSVKFYSKGADGAHKVEIKELTRDGWEQKSFESIKNGIIYTNNGVKSKLEVMPDKTIVVKNEKDVIIHKKFPDGKDCWFDEEEGIWFVSFPDGTQRNYDPNGTLLSEFFTDKSSKSWHPNGTLASELSKDGSIKHWDKNGNLYYHKLSDGTILRNS